MSRCQPVIFVAAPVFRQAAASHFHSGLNRRVVILTENELMARIANSAILKENAFAAFSSSENLEISAVVIL